MNIFKFKALKLFLNVKQLLDLKYDFDEQGTYEAIQSGTEFKSGNAWSLIFAIFIASIGLNVNSTAVIIGAMLISPLMGPIVGTGYSLGTHNFELLKKSLKHLAYAVIISIITSAIFFLISPAGADQSELMARTQPTFFDAMIAFFGGAAGIVASTRKTKGNAIPGVAIATALMPPLCTVGYGIANLEISYIIGALYLFAINATFILISTYLFVRLLNFKWVFDRNPDRDLLIHRYMTWVSVIIIIPSLYMAWYLHKKVKFENGAALFLKKEMNFTNTLIASKEIKFDVSTPMIHIKLFGDQLSEVEKDSLLNKMKLDKTLSSADLRIEFIGRDSFSIDDLERKFVTKNDFDQLLKMENSKLLSSTQEKALKITKKVNAIYKNSVESTSIQNNNVEFKWKKYPTRGMLQKAERISYEALLDNGPVFLHSVVIK